MLSCQNKFLVRTNGNVGITNEDANRVINILNRNDMWNDKLNSLIMESMTLFGLQFSVQLRRNLATAADGKQIADLVKSCVV